MGTLTESVVLQSMTCYNCGITYALPERYLRERRENGGSWVCPNGHSSVFRQSEVEKLTQQLQFEQRRSAEALEREKAAQRAREVTERKFKRHRRRVSNGVCPCCNRSFVNLGRHMKTQHPEAVIPATKKI
jgi:ssDNA-binding Zn-finger/Zn-ribbon topoisomerase 1